MKSLSIIYESRLQQVLTLLCSSCPRIANSQGLIPKVLISNIMFLDSGHTTLHRSKTSWKIQNLPINLILLHIMAKPVVLYLYSMWFPKILLPVSKKRGLAPHPKKEGIMCTRKKIDFLFYNRFCLFGRLTPILLGCIYWTRQSKKGL